MRKPSVISLFSGAGGLDYGFEAAGFRTGVCVEINRDACETLGKSRPRWNVINRSIFDVETAEMLSAANVRVGEIDVVMGGPPCQPFSKSGYWATGDAKRLDDPRADTLDAFLRVVREARPKTFLLENVVGLKFTGKDEGLQRILRGVQMINRATGTHYAPVIATLNAAAFGVPQRRERVIIIAARDGTKLSFPQETHGESSQGDLFERKKLAATTTAWDAIAHAPKDYDEDLAVRGKWGALLPSIPEGYNYLWHTRNGIEQARAEGERPGKELFGWRRRYWSFLLKLAKDKPSWTIQAQPGPASGPFHWDNRLLSTRELARLQTFPDDTRFVGERLSRQKQIGNAVPSLLGEVLARAIRSQLLGARMSDALVLLPKHLSRAPKPAPYCDVPAQFHSYEGHHAAHPGTGFGYRARLRSEEFGA